MSKLTKYGLSQLSPEQPVLIAGPTASGKSSLALAIAETQGGVIVNADASQIYNCWRVITACPSKDDEARALHALYRHTAYNAPHSAGHWLREVAPFLEDAQRPIIVGGTGLYFTALTQGLADIPATPPEVRWQGDKLDLAFMLEQLDLDTVSRIDVANRARVQRAWEVHTSTGRGLAQWQDETPPPLVDPEHSFNIILDAEKEWLTPRIEQRFDLMVAGGAMDEIASMDVHYDPTLPSCRAIGVPELTKCHRGELDLQAAREEACIATRQYAKRQRTWFRSKMRNWNVINTKEM
ncbi:tRNA (adenosine(37)-N6)-dimethylallyltransferase MiaA [Ascidiaceihabitans sp.]|nr:tRNA (adenosine(37)-N6)-dimethylallyltransferase MiaA [Ascidiaceihabitans sp.]MDB4198127.1 tRNA (adenosine(37)-N6)-dimethylallyltransferase MiaA [Ascidiaceihabitans sp.]